METKTKNKHIKIRKTLIKCLLDFLYSNCFMIFFCLEFLTGYTG